MHIPLFLVNQNASNDLKYGIWVWLNIKSSYNDNKMSTLSFDILFMLINDMYHST